MDECPSTEAPASSGAAQRSAQPTIPAWFSIKSGVVLPEKVALLRWKLYQKAKQEPRCSQRSYQPPAGKWFYARVHDLGLNTP